MILFNTAAVLDWVSWK